MSVSLDTAIGNLSGGSFSVAVLDELSAVPVKEASSIKKDFEIPEPSREMLTEFIYAIEHGITINGICRDRKKKGKKSNLTILPEDMQSIYTVATRDNGEFSLKGLTFYDSAKFGIQPADEHVTWKNREAPPLPKMLPHLKLSLKPLSAIYAAPTTDTLKMIMLKEVSVTEKKTVQYENSYAEPDYYIKSESIETYQNLGAAIAAKLPQFKFFYYETHWYLIWARGEFTRANGAPSEPVLYVDHALVVGETVGDRLYYINPSMIDHIEVKGMIGSNLGANGANGMISVFTKRFNEPAFKGLPIIKARGFDRPMSFDSPNYDNPSANSKIDNRATLYWNPLVTISSTLSPTKLFFFTSDRAGKYRVIVEGVTKEGIPIHSEAVIFVRE